MSIVIVTHMPEEGTLATGDTRPYAATFRAHHWRWSRILGAWYIPHSRDTSPYVERINAIAAAIEQDGGTVTLDLCHERTSTADREAHRTERLSQRRDALTAKSARSQQDADAAYARSHELAGRIPLGQPVLVGHHSARRHRRDLATIASAMDTAVAGWAESAEAARKAEASDRTERHRLTGPATLRRIARLDAETRDVARKLDRAEPGTAWHERLTARAAKLADSLAYWREHLATLESAGWKRWSAADFAPGDKVITRFGIRTVVRVNPKSLSVESGYSWTDKLPYDEVRGKVEPDPDPDPDEPPPIVVTASGLQCLLPGETPPPLVKGDAAQQTLF